MVDTKLIDFDNTVLTLSEKHEFVSVVELQLNNENVCFDGNSLVDKKLKVLLLTTTDGVGVQFHFSRDKKEKLVFRDVGEVKDVNLEEGYVMCNSVKDQMAFVQEHED